MAETNREEAAAGNCIRIRKHLRRLKRLQRLNVRAHERLQREIKILEELIEKHLSRISHKPLLRLQIRSHRLGFITS